MRSFGMLADETTLFKNRPNDIVVNITMIGHRTAFTEDQNQYYLLVVGDKKHRIICKTM